MIDPDVIEELELLRRLASPRPELTARTYRDGYVNGYQDALGEVFELLEDEMDVDE